MQALASIGQSRLMSLWDSLFGHLSQPVAQILLTRTDIADRTQYLNAQNTLSELLSMGVIPIVNENDTLAVSEIKFGDNDTLSAITAAMVQADYLFLMTDVDALYDKNPRKYPDAKAIEVVSDIDALEVDVSSAGSALGTGGMATKIVAARLATSAGTTVIITKSSKPGNVSDIISYLHPPVEQVPSTTNGSSLTPERTASPATAPLHTRFLPSLSPIRSRAFWILHGLAAHGTLYIDQGARAALTQKAGLLPVGVVAVEGVFAQQEAVRLVVVDRHQWEGSKERKERPASMTNSGHLPEKNETNKGEEIGRAVVNYSSTEIVRIAGIRSSEIQGVLGYADSDYICLRENVSLISSEREKGDSNGRNTPSGLRTPSKKLVLGHGHERVMSGASLNGGDNSAPESPKVGGLIDWV
jgi:glutamate 5-kinase